ncbi:hypothetical protein KY284_036683 [Solanum tuberosum]|nr:hypothetical protein KY284_036683 [Solanum tuberosum]
MSIPGICCYGWPEKKGGRGRRMLSVWSCIIFPALLAAEQSCCFAGMREERRHRSCCSRRTLLPVADSSPEKGGETRKKLVGQRWSLRCCCFLLAPAKSIGLSFAARRRSLVAAGVRITGRCCCSPSSSSLLAVGRSYWRRERPRCGCSSLRGGKE